MAVADGGVLIRTKVSEVRLAGRNEGSPSKRASRGARMG
jgi:hypothetical protein